MVVSIKTAPEILEHDLNKYFPELLKFESIKETEKSKIYKKIEPKILEILNAIVKESYTPNIKSNAVRDHISALAWNIERGSHLEEIIEKLKSHNSLKGKDLYLLTELDYGMARSRNHFVAQKIAKALKLNYAFAPIYIALQKGSGVESEVVGENKQSIHGLSIFSKYPLNNVHAVALPNGKDKMVGKEKRLGYPRALIADIEHPLTTFRAVTAHLDVHCSRKHRQLQVKIILKHLENLPRLPTIVGGDFNTTTHNAQDAIHAILGFWRRVFMGLKNVVKNYYPYPERYFERNLFREFTARGFEYEKFNEIGAGTLHYDIKNVAHNTNLGDWIPSWCFPFIFWASRKVGGKFSLRLDWFVGKDIKISPGTKPQTIGNLVNKKGTPISDHDAITLDFVPRKI